MERLIFSHKDIDRDELEVKEADEELTRHRGSLLFVVESDDLEPRSVALTPDKVDDLIGALERWRSGVVTARETSTPPANLEPIYDAIVKRLTDEWLPRVLPLHQAPQAAVLRCDYDCSHCESDDEPDPHDVGHADEPAKPHPTDWSDKLFGKPSYDAEPKHGRLMSELPRRVHSDGECGECGHSWRMHPPAFGVSYCAQYTDAVVCGCQAVRGTA